MASYILCDYVPKITSIFYQVYCTQWPCAMLPRELDGIAKSKEITALHHFGFSEYTNVIGCALLVTNSTFKKQTVVIVFYNPTLNEITLIISSNLFNLFTRTTEIIWRCQEDTLEENNMTEWFDFLCNYLYDAACWKVFIKTHRYKATY